MELKQEERNLQQEELCEEITENDVNRLFEDNFKLVYHFAKRCYSHLAYIDKEDIIQEGALGLWVACNKFDPSLGFKFSTFASPYIKGYMLRMLRDNEPIKTSRGYKNINLYMRSHNMELPLSDEDKETIVSEGICSMRFLDKYQEISILSLDHNYSSDDSESNLTDILEGDTEIDLSFSDDEFEDIVDYILKLSMLEGLHRDIYEEYLYSVIYDEPLTQYELAFKYNTSQANISRLLKRAKDRLLFSKEKLTEIIL